MRLDKHLGLNEKRWATCVTRRKTLHQKLIGSEWWWTSTKTTNARDLPVKSHDTSPIVICKPFSMRCVTDLLVTHVVHFERLSYIYGTKNVNEP